MVENASSGLIAGQTDTRDDLDWAQLEIAKAQRQIARGMSELAEGIVSLSLVLLDVRRRRLYRFDPDYPTFERYVEGRHGISAHQANLYVEALTSLGAEHYRTLLTDLGFQRTYALAMLQRADPALVAALQQLPAEERQAVTVREIERVDATVTAELRARVTQLERDLTREQGLFQQARRRLQDAEELHQRVSSTLIEERDQAQQALNQEQAQTERLRALLDAARLSMAEAAGSTAPRLEAPAAGTSQPVSEAVVVVVAGEVGAVIGEVRAVTAKLARLTHMQRDDVPPDQRRDLAGALQDLRRTIQTLLNG